MPTVREVTIEWLRKLEMTTIFGNPGSTEMPMFEKFPTDFTYILGLQEAAVVGMAEGFAQATRRAALVNLHTAPGVGNAMGNIIAAHHHKTPLVITAGQQVRPMQHLEPFLFSREAIELPKPYVKWSYEPSRAEDVPRAILRAYFTAMQAPRGPVFVSIPMDDWNVEMDSLPLDHEVSFWTAPDPKAIDQLATQLKAARRPVLVVGPDVDREGAWENTLRLAEALQCEVFGSPISGRVSFPEDHPLYQGQLPAGQAPLAKRLGNADLVVVLGAPIFNYYPYVPGPTLPEGATLVQLTSDPNEAARAPVGRSIVGSVALGISRLLEALPTSSRRGSEKKPTAPPPETADELMSPEVAFHALAGVLADDDILVEEAPSTRRAMQKYVRVTQTGGYYSTGGGGLGYAMPAAVGVQLAEPKRRVVSILGDGSSLYSIQALWTAAHYRLPIIYVIVDNAQYGILKAFGEFLGLSGVPGLDLPGVDITDIAKGFGCRAEKASSPEALQNAFLKAKEDRTPTLIHVKISQVVPSLV